jgi:hypothetical protein
MGYIKISDPNIIDLGAWHQVINVVNQHSDSLNSLTNNFGKVNPASVDYNAEAYSHLFDSGSQMILYGRSKITVTPGQGTSVNGKVYYTTVQMAGPPTGVPAFSSTPVVTATINDGNTSGGTFTNSNDDAIVSVYNVTPTTFAWRVYRASNVAITGTFYINWMAIGPRGH